MTTVEEARQAYILAMSDYLDLNIPTSNNDVLLSPIAGAGTQKGQQGGRIGFIITISTELHRSSYLDLIRGDLVVLGVDLDDRISPPKETDKSDKAKLWRSAWGILDTLGISRTAGDVQVQNEIRLRSKN